MNSYNVTGRLIKDMEISQTKTGKPMAKYTIAKDIGWGDVKKTLFLNVVQFFGISEKYVGKKGDIISLTGELDYFDTEVEGKKNQRIYVKAMSFSIEHRHEPKPPVEEKFNTTDAPGQDNFQNQNPFSDDLPF